MNLHWAFNTDKLAQKAMDFYDWLFDALILTFKPHKSHWSASQLSLALD